MPRQDDPSISGDILLYRRIPPDGGRVEWENGRPIPSSQNYRDRNDELSAYIAAETTPELALAGHTGFGLVQFTAGAAREHFGPAIIICRDDEEPANGHVLICGKVSNGAAKRFKVAVSWVDGFWPAPPIAS